MAAIDTLPASIRDRIVFSPVEDVLLYLLRQAFPDVTVRSLLPEKLESANYPFILARKSTSLGDWQGDPRFIDRGHFEIQVYTKDPDGDELGALVSEAVRSALHDAWQNHVTVPGKGTVLKITLENEPHRASDMQTSSGPVQYADLPTGVWRYESEYSISIRRPL